MSSLRADWGYASEKFDPIKKFVGEKDLSGINEAQTRYDVIDRLVREVLGWSSGMVKVEDHSVGKRKGFVDYLLRAGDFSIVVEAKKVGAAFPSPTDKARLKFNGSVLSAKGISEAIEQAKEYARVKKSKVIIVTNGLCWCYFNLEKSDGESYANLLFPFSKDGHAERLFDIFACGNVALGSLSKVTNEEVAPEERLLTAFRVADDRVDRNNIADHIAPALDQALYSESLLVNVDALKRCFVTTEARTKFDAMLGMHLGDPKPNSVVPAKRINRGKSGDHLETILKSSSPSYAPPVTLIIGTVGAGKSTYLKHFEMVAGRNALSAKKAHWIYIDLEGLGVGGDPRRFIYEKILKYLGGLISSSDDHDKYVKPAYAEDVKAWKAGPLAMIAGDSSEINKILSQKIFEDYEKVEPYVDKVLGYIARNYLAVIVLDNVDLYEDDSLETRVFAEGLALSKRVFCHVMVSIRDTTFVKHKTDSAFDAYELRKLWLDPPPLKAVISARLSYSKKILEKKSATIDLPNNKYLAVPDLSFFFDIVQQSILRGEAGDYIEAISDLNVRKGISLVKNFLTSGHIEADRALQQYLSGNLTYYFPFHEVFKGSMLGQWRHFSESHAEGINIFDSRLGSRRLRLLRCFLLQFLLQRAKFDHSMEVKVSECCEIFAGAGAVEDNILACLITLNNHRLIKTVDAADVSRSSSVLVTRAGGFYVKILSRKFVYVEECMYDTAIDSSAWQRVHDLTAEILAESNSVVKMRLRKNRMMVFLQYLSDIEGEISADSPNLSAYRTIEHIRTAVLDNVDEAIRKIKSNTPRRHWGRNV